MTKQEFITKLNPSIFWEYEPGKIDPEKHKLLILERILTRGSLDEFRLMIEYYGIDEMKSLVIKIKTLDTKTLNLLSVIFDIPETDFICYEKKQWM